MLGNFLLHRVLQLGMGDAGELLAAWVGRPQIPLVAVLFRLGSSDTGGQHDLTQPVPINFHAPITLAPASA